jgi:hypothetical protein
MLLTVCVGASCEAKQIAVIVDKANTVGGLTAVDLAKVFKFDKNKWPDGKNVVLVLRDPTTPEMRTAIEKLYHMQPEEFRALLSSHSSGVIFAKTEEELLRSVESIPGAVGLVDVYSINGHVNVLKVDGKLPLEQGYSLKGN